MSLDGTSTFDDALAEYRDTADWDLDGSVAKARRFVVACRHLLMRPSLAGKGSSQVAFDHKQVRAELERAQTYVASAAAVGTGAASVRHVDLREFRT
jgi:hypothetical protein